MRIKPQSRKTYTAEHKVWAVRIAKELGLKQATLLLDISYGTLSQWMHNADKSKSGIELKNQLPCEPIVRVIKELLSENEHLLVENKRLTALNDFLKEESRFLGESRRQ